MKHLTTFYLLSFLLTASLLHAQEIDTAHPSYVYAHAFLETFKELLAIPNDAHYPDQIEKNIKWCEGKLHTRNFTTKRLETETVPLLVAQYNKIIEHAPTILFYIHIDGQPVDSSFWFQENPYKAVLKKEEYAEGWSQIDWDLLKTDKIDPEWRIFARSASDDKAPMIMFLAALETMEAMDLSIPYNFKIVLDFEEEIGSPRFAEAVEKYRGDLASDMLIIFDGPKHPSNQPTIAFGARGNTTLTIKVFGPSYPLHSGHYGNYAPNPALRLSKLLGSMKDDEGRVVIPGYYDGIHLDEKTKEILASVPDDEQSLMVKLGIGEKDMVGNNYQEALQYPSLNIRGMASAWIGNEARTIVPASATAEIDIRLVVESDGDRLKQLVRKHIENQGYYIVDHKPDSRERYLHPKICQISSRENYTKAFRTELDSELGKWIYTNIKNAFNQEPIRLRTMGGTLPISPFISTLNVPAVIIPIANSDNNQHSPNENLRIGNYFDGVKTIYHLLSTSFE